MSSIGPEGERSSSEVSLLDSNFLWLYRTIPGQETLGFLAHRELSHLPLFFDCLFLPFFHVPQDYFPGIMCQYCGQGGSQVLTFFC